jgi:hypothetical protein
MARPVEIEVPIMVLLTMSPAGARIMKSNGKYRSRTYFFTAALVAVLIPMPKGYSQQETETEVERVLDLRIIDKATQKPIQEVKLGIRIMRQRRVDKTDSEGRCRISLGAVKADYVRIEAQKDGFVPVRLNWREGSGRPQIPDQYTLALERGTSIGGTIQDEQGRPIEGVSVFLLIPSSDEVERIAIWDHEVRTDKDGRWRCDIVPSQLDEIKIRLVHREHISDGTYGTTPQPSMEQLRAMTGVMTMERYFTVSGHVFDANDHPIAGASVAQGSDRLSSSFPSTQTDAEGRFEFKHVQSDMMVLTAQAKGHSPDLIQFTVHRDMEPLEFDLEPGRTIRGRIVDSAGKPVADAFVTVDTWRGHRSLDWHTRTDPNGCFQWNDAPVDEVLINISKEGYMGISNYGILPSEQEQEITLPDILRIHGKVVDAETGDPIPEIKLISGIDYGEDRSVFWRRRSNTFTQGQYEIQYTQPYPAHFIRIEADGYKPADSRPIRSDEGDVTIDFELEKGQGPRGVVFLPDGKPAMGAEVILCTPSYGVYIQNGRQRYDGQYVKTKEDGQFSFPDQTDVYAIVVLHDEGYVEVTEDELTESSELKLQPWARVEGKLIIGKEPGAHEEMRLRFDRRETQNGLRFYYACNTSTDDKGNFVFERIVPGNVMVYHEIKVGQATHFSHGLPLEIKAGETHRITIGGTGRPVIGKILIPDYFKSTFDWRYTNYGLRINNSKGPYNQLGLKIEEDGTFRIEDVPAGDYTLHFNAYVPSAVPRSFGGETIAFLNRNFNVPEIPSGRSDEPLDLGILELDVIRKSDYAPSLAGRSLPDWNDIMIDFTPEQAKNKMILVCFFDMNQRPSRHYISQLTQRAKLLEDKGVSLFAVQTLKVDENALNEWVKKNNVPFTVGRIEGDEENTRFTWGVKSLPWLLLTNKDHNVSSSGFSLDELGEKIQFAQE